MKAKQLNKEYEKAKAEYLADIQNDDGTYTCLGCFNSFTTIEIHHIIKRRFKYFFVDKRNFIELCFDCHQKAEGTIEQQKGLKCYGWMEAFKYNLLSEYHRLKPYEQTLLYRYG